MGPVSATARWVPCRTHIRPCMVFRCLALVVAATALPCQLQSGRDLKRSLPIRGGGSASTEVWQRVQEKDGLFAPVGPARRRKFLFRTESFAQTISNSTSTFYVKAPGSLLNPGNWPLMLRSIVTGAPERSVRMVPMNKDVGQEGPLVMIDGADDIATALQGSGLPQNLASALQAFVLYPLVLPVVELGFRGAQDDHDENTAEAHEAARDIAKLKAGLVDQLALLREAAAADPGGRAAVEAFEDFAARTPGPRSQQTQDPEVQDVELDAGRASSWWTRLKAWALQYPRVQAEVLEPTKRHATLQGRVCAFLLQADRRHMRAEARGYHFESHLRDLAFVAKARAVLACICSRHRREQSSAHAHGDPQGGGWGGSVGGDAGTRAPSFARRDPLKGEHGAQIQPVDFEELGQAIRLLAALDGVVSKAWEPRVRASFTSPVAMLATAAMWWAMLCYQLVALAEFLGPDNAFLAQWLLPGCRGLAKYLLPLGQACMAVYGLSVGINGLREGAELEEELTLVRRSAALANFPDVQHVLRHQLCRLWSANLAAEVVAGPLLFAGQALMAIGAPGMLGNGYVLAFGGLLSAISIVSKTVVELDTEARFGYNDDALPVPQILVSHVPGHVPNCTHASDVRTLAVIQRRREARLRKLAWLKALSAVVPIIASKKSDSEEVGWSVERRAQLVDTLYKNGYDFELHQCLKQILITEDAWRVLASAAEVYGGAGASDLVEWRGDTSAPSGCSSSCGGTSRARCQQPLYLAFLYVKGVEEALGKAGAAFHDDDECIAAEESEERWILSTTAALADAMATWKTLQHPQRIQKVLGSLQTKPQQLTDSVHHAVLEELLIHQSLRPRGHSCAFSRGVDFSASLSAATAAPPTAGFSQSQRGGSVPEGGNSAWRRSSAGSRLLGGLVERTVCWQKRRIKIPGSTLWRYLKSKHAYRFQLQRFLALLHSHPLVRPSSPVPPPPGTAVAGQPVGKEEGRAERGLERFREEERVWRERGVALGWASAAVEEACWRVVKLEAKKMLRSEVACLNEALLELLREHEIRTDMLSRLTSTQPASANASSPVAGKASS